MKTRTRQLTILTIAIAGAVSAAMAAPRAATPGWGEKRTESSGWGSKRTETSAVDRNGVEGSKRGRTGTETPGWGRTDTAIAALRPDGNILEVSTGSRGGTCSAHDNLMTCADGGRVVRADLEGGCLEASGGARCSVRLPGEPALDGEPPILVETDDVTGIDVVCQTGDFRGWIFTIKDADGSGDCALNLDGERTSGGTCRHRDKTVCLEVSCKTGCIGGTGGCTCSVKKEGNNSVKTED